MLQKPSWIHNLFKDNKSFLEWTRLPYFVLSLSFILLESVEICHLAYLLVSQASRHSLVGRFIRSGRMAARGNEHFRTFEAPRHCFGSLLGQGFSRVGRSCVSSSSAMCLLNSDQSDSIVGRNSESVGDSIWNWSREIHLLCSVRSLSAISLPVSPICFSIAG